MSPKDDNRLSAPFSALYAICLGVLLVVVDTTVLAVALPSITAQLDVPSELSVWLPDAYLLTYGGFLVFCGGLGDLYGRRPVYLSGIGLFTAASLGCGLAQTTATMLVARAVQGLGGAAVISGALSLIGSLFPDPASRAKAMGLYAFVCAAGGGVGEMLAGMVTQTMGWHWVFLVNLPIGALVYALCLRRLPHESGVKVAKDLDVTGALLLTVALALAVYCIVNGGRVGWRSLLTLASFTGCTSIFLGFLMLESRLRTPLLPPELFRLGSFCVANGLGFLWSAGNYTWFIIAALYLQNVLRYSPIEVGLAFIPSELAAAALSVWLAPIIVARHGHRMPTFVGLICVAAGLGLFAISALQTGSFVAMVLPGMLLLGLGGGLASSPILLVALCEIDDENLGVASGVTNTAFTLGAAVGYTVLASAAERRTSILLSAGLGSADALAGGYHLAFLAAALVVGMAAVISVLALRAPIVGLPAPLTESDHA